MNKKTTYELTITEKLAHLPLPDMEDAIWARVKTQLDLDLPTDDSNDDGDAPDTPSGSGWMWWGAGSFLFVAAFLSIFLLTKKPTTQDNPIVSPAQTIQNTGTPAAVEQQVDNTRQPVENRADDAGPVFTPGSSPPIPVFNNIDSALALPTVSLPLPDSGQRTAVVLPPPVAQDTLLPKKKTRGVTGITDNDYRIVPTKKDSS